MITDVQLAQSTGCKLITADAWLPWVNEALDVFEINTLARISAFLAQIGHESGGLHFVRELWGPTAAQRGYEGRQDLGNTQPGDGPKYKGHGLIQITGRSNHALCRDGLKARGLDCPDFEAEPEKLELPRWAAMSAGWFWTDYKHLNALADSGDFERITKKINGGLNGYDERVSLWEMAKETLA